MPRNGTFLPDGEKVRRLRAGRGWKQKELATKSGVSKRTVERIECGEAATAEVLGWVAGALGVTAADLMAEEDGQVQAAETSAPAQSFLDRLGPERRADLLALAAAFSGAAAPLLQSAHPVGLLLGLAWQRSLVKEYQGHLTALTVTLQVICREAERTPHNAETVRLKALDAIDLFRGLTRSAYDHARHLGAPGGVARAIKGVIDPFGRESHELCHGPQPEHRLGQCLADVVSKLDEQRRQLEPLDGQLQQELNAALSESAVPLSRAFCAEPLA